MDPFFKAVYELVARVPRGKVVSYGQVGRLLGYPRSARQVGRAMRHCPDGLPWQRVVMADGAITGGLYAPLRRAMLEEEGITFLPDGRVDMQAHRWQPEVERSAPMTYTTRIPSPLGDITLMSDGEHLTGLWFVGQAHYGAGLPLDAVESSLPVFDHTQAWLTRYFRGEDPGTPPPLAPKGTPFQQRVWQMLSAIPPGQVRTYGDLARQLEAAQGAPTFARAVGAAVGRNPISILIPCHRVMGADGRLIGYAGGLDRKQWLLHREGAVVQTP